MDGFYIAGEPLTKEAAMEIDRLLTKVTILGESADSLLTLRASLHRVISGKDKVVVSED